jgi:Uma2 family endonuclease
MWLFVDAAQLPAATNRIKGFARLAPDLAVEVVSPSNTSKELEAKLRDYLSAGTRLIWLIHPGDPSVRVHRPDGTRSILGVGDHLDGEDVVPGFRVSVAQLFSSR